MSDPIHVVCPACDSINRLPADRLAANGKCGKCHKPLLGNQPVSLNTARFQKFISRNDLPVLVDFWAPWCGPCKMMAPIFEQAAAQLQTKMLLAKVNTEEEQGLAAQYGIRSIPTLAIFRRGQEVTRMAGAMDLNNLLQWATSQI